MTEQSMWYSRSSTNTVSVLEFSKMIKPMLFTFFLTDLFIYFNWRPKSVISQTYRSLWFPLKLFWGFLIWRSEKDPCAVLVNERLRVRTEDKHCQQRMQSMWRLLTANVAVPDTSLGYALPMENNHGIQRWKSLCQTVSQRKSPWFLMFLLCCLYYLHCEHHVHMVTWSVLHGFTSAL